MTEALEANVLPEKETLVPPSEEYRGWHGTIFTQRNMWYEIINKDANHEKRQEPFVFPYLIGVAKTGET
jgi:hypothetical protein